MIKVMVPATTANMGCGFDCLGMALGLYNSVEVEEIEKGLEIEIVDKELQGLIPQDESNLIYKTMNHLFNIAGVRPSGLKIRQQSKIPTSRGLGSSSACIVGGIVAANALIGNKLSKDELLQEAIKLEGHPDNVAPAMMGGMVASIKEQDRYICEKIEVSKELDFYAVIPDFELKTTSSRGVLPEMVKINDAVCNIGRGMLLIKAFLTDDYENISGFFNDKLHQDYRAQFIPHMFDIFDFCKENNCTGTYLSGAGPTLMVISHNDCFSADKLYNLLKEYKLNWKIQKLKADNTGAIILN